VDSESEVVDFSINRKRVWYFLLALYSNLSPCRVSEILELLYFPGPSLFRSKCLGIALGVNPWYWVLQRANTQAS